MSEPVRSCRTVQVIETVFMRGNGLDEVCRQVVAYWSLEGDFIGEFDPCAKEPS